MQENTVTRAYLAESLFKKLGFSKSECSDLVDVVLEEVNEGLRKDGEVKISSFGTFRVKQKKERIGRNPKTKEIVPIIARKVVSFYISNILKKRVNS